MVYAVIAGLIGFVLLVLSQLPDKFKKILASFGSDISKRSHAFIISSLTKKYNDSVLEKKKEMFNQIAQHINSNDVRILEIGAGSGANLGFYPTDVKIQFVAIEPNVYMKKYLVDNLKSYKNIQLEKFSTNYAEDMKDVPSNSIDCVVSTVVMCSVNNQEKVLSEVKRVLKPGCPFFFMEHVAAKPGSYLHKTQRIFRAVWSVVFDGCQVTRETLPQLQTAGFSELKYKRFNARLNYHLSFVRPHIFGYATK